MKINLIELIETQREVDKVVFESLERIPTSEQRILAFNVELFEYFNRVGL